MPTLRTRVGERTCERTCECGMVTGGLQAALYQTRCRYANPAGLLGGMTAYNGVFPNQPIFLNKKTQRGKKYHVRGDNYCKGEKEEGDEKRIKAILLLDRMAFIYFWF